MVVVAAAVVAVVALLLGLDSDRHVLIHGKQYEQDRAFIVGWPVPVPARLPLGRDDWFDRRVWVEQHCGAVFPTELGTPSS